MFLRMLSLKLISNRLLFMKQILGNLHLPTALRRKGDRIDADPYGIRTNPHFLKLDGVEGDQAVESSTLLSAYHNDSCGGDALFSGQQLFFPWGF